MGGFPTKSMISVTVIASVSESSDYYRFTCRFFSGISGTLDILSWSSIHVKIKLMRDVIGFNFCYKIVQVD